MTALDKLAYRPTDTLFLWWLADPQHPVLVGTLSTARATKGVSLRYNAHWLRAGFALSEDLPLLDMEFMPTQKETAVGAVDDARPDRWGERIIRYLDKPARLSLMEYLWYAGDERFGALGISASNQVYSPRRMGPLPVFEDVQHIAALVKKVFNAEPVADAERRLIAPGATLGGARPKALLNMGGHPWVLKFAEPTDSVDTPLIEHATMTLATKAGIRAAATRPIALQGGHALAVQRFDRADGRRRHALSASVALKAAGETMGYPELAQLLRRRGVATGQRNRADMHELYRRMVFNILMDNTDDHEKNHALLATDAGSYELAPAFDVLPSGQALGYQQMRVGSEAADSTLANALSEHKQFALSLDQARENIHQVAATVSGWKDHFAATGVSACDIDSLAQQIDRPFLRDQRDSKSS